MISLDLNTGLVEDSEDTVTMENEDNAGERKQKAVNTKDELSTPFGKDSVQFKIHIQCVQSKLL